MIYIDEVTKVRDEYGNMVIGRLFWTENLYVKATSWCTKRRMIDYINQNPNNTKTKYIRNGLWVTGEDVRVVDNNYLRTDGNNIKADNLGELER